MKPIKVKRDALAMLPFYILEGRQPVRCRDIERLYEFATSNKRIIARTTVGDAEVSTVFLISGIGANPSLFETMVFGGRHDNRQIRYRTYDEAEAGHARMVAYLQDEHNE